MCAIYLLSIAGLLGCTKPPPSTDDSGQADDTATQDDTGDSGDTGTPACPEDTVTFVGADGMRQDLTSQFLSGDYVTIAVPGTLEFCPATWYARVLVRADTTVVGLGASPEDTVLSGGLSGTILDVAGPDVSLTVQNVTLDRGAGLDVDHNSGGGGVYCEQQGAVTISDAIFSNNEANDGPGMYTRDCTVAVSNTSFVDNVAEDDGGAVTLWDSTATFDQVRVEGNQSLDGGGMAVFASDVTATGLSIIDNTSGGFSGGIWLYQSTISLTDSVFSGNTDRDGMYGGGLLVYGDATLERVSFTGNTAPLGGGIYVYYESTVQGTDCDFSDNSPQDIFAGDGTTDGGVSYDAGSGYSFWCAANLCHEG